MLVETLYADEHGTDLLIDNLHNVNLDWQVDTLSTVTHTSRDGQPMEVQFNSKFGTYFVLVAGRKMALCASCFEAIHNFEPDMGDGETTFSPGICSSCGGDKIVFSFID